MTSKKSTLETKKGYFRKKLIPCGVHTTKQGSLYVDPERNKHWVNMFRCLKAEGVSFPVPWGHHVKAIPKEGKLYLSALSSDSESEFSKFNATYLDDLIQCPDGSVDIIAKLPPGYEVEEDTGDLISKEKGTRIKEVSAGIGDWTDGKGRTHEDIIIHAALVPLAVVANQEPFVALSTQGKYPELTYMLSTSTRSGNMAKDDNKKDKKPADEKAVAEKKDMPPIEDEADDSEDFLDGDSDLDDDGDSDVDLDLDMDLDSVLGDSDPVDTDPTVNVPSMDGPGGNKEQIEALQLLRQMGLPLPEDVDSAKIWDTLCVALRTAFGMGAKFTKPGDQPQAQQEPPVTMNTMQNAQPTPEMPPMLMSTADIQDPLTKKLAQSKENDLRKRLIKGWEEAKTLGCPADIADPYIEAAKTRFTLSLNVKEGRFKLPSSFTTLKLVKKILKANGGEKTITALTNQLSTAQPVEHPIVTSKKDEDGSQPLTETQKTDQVNVALYQGASGLKKKKK